VKLGIALSALAGLVAATALVAYQGFGAVAGALAAAGFGLVWVAVFHLLPMLFSTLAWRALVVHRHGAPGVQYFCARWIREAVDALLPVAQVGGELVGARLLVHRGMPGSIAGAGVVADFTTETVTQFLFTLFGLAVLVLDGHHGDTVRWIAFGVLVFAPALAGFVLAQRWGLFRRVESWLERVAERWPWMGLTDSGSLHDTLQELYRNRARLAAASAYHLGAWVLGAGEVWLALHLMGHPAGMKESLVLESLGQAVRSAAFLVPGGLGVQEGGYILLGALYGLPPQVALAVSLAKRFRELVLGLPGLLAWQILEGRRLWLTTQRRANPPRPGWGEGGAPAAGVPGLAGIDPDIEIP
jgi:putative membrane protein